MTRKLAVIPAYIYNEEHRKKLVDMPDPNDKKLSRDDGVRAHYVLHDDIQNPNVDASVIYKDAVDARKGVGFEGGKFGDTVIVPVTFNWSEAELGIVPGKTAEAIRAGEQDITSVMLDEHQQSLALDALQRVAEQSGANIKFVVVDELPDNKGIRFGEYNTGRSLMSTAIEERAEGDHHNLYDGHVHDVDRGEYYSIVANPYGLNQLNDQQTTYAYMHEIGHALGFDHPNTGLNSSNVQWGETVMRTQQSKFDHFIKNPSLELGEIDIEAFQQLYGVNNGRGAMMVDMRGQPPELVSRELLSHGYDPEKELAYNNRVENEAGVQEQGNERDNYLKGTQYNDTFTGNGGDDHFYVSSGHDTVTDFKASGNYDWYDSLTGTEEDVLVAPEGAVSATVVKQLDESIIITFEDEQGAMPGVSVRLENFTGDHEDIDILTQENGRKGDEINVYHYDDNASTLGANEIDVINGASSSLSVDNNPKQSLNLSADFSSAMASVESAPEQAQAMQTSTFSAFKV